MRMDQTLNRIAESLAILLNQGDGEGEGGGRQRPRLGRTSNVLPSQDSLPSYDQLSSSPSSFSSNAASVTLHPNPNLSISGSQDESCWALSVYLMIWYLCEISLGYMWKRNTIINIIADISTLIFQYIVSALVS